MNTNNGWLDIASAPKDFSTEFDGWNGERIPNVIWAHPEYELKGEYAWCRSVYEHDHGWSMERVKGLTHWMPLPSAPSKYAGDHDGMENDPRTRWQQPATPPASAQDSTEARTGYTAAEQEAYWRGFEQAQLNAQHNAKVQAGHCCERAQAQGIAVCDECVRENEKLREAWTAAASTVADEGAKDERQIDACPRCDGSGEITVMSDNSPDANEVIVCCDHCQGSGAATDAAKYLAAALSGEKYRHMQLWAEYRNFHRSLCARFGYGHDQVHFRRDLVSLEEHIAAKTSAPAAGDARELLRTLKQVGALVTRAKTDKDTVLGAKALRDLKSAEEKVAAALSASQQGGE